MTEYLVLLGFVAALYGIFVYLKDTLSGKTKPDRVSWLMWSIAPLIATVAALTEGGYLGCFTRLYGGVWTALHINRLFLQ